MKLLPYEFYLLNVKFEEWNPLDSQTLLSFYFYDLHSGYNKNLEKKYFCKKYNMFFKIGDQNIIKPKFYKLMEKI